MKHSQNNNQNNHKKNQTPHIDEQKTNRIPKKKNYNI
jgi:hypothetical protein